MESQFEEINLDELTLHELNLKKSVSSPPPGLVLPFLNFFTKF